MKVFAFRSIHTQFMTATTLLIVGLVGSIVWIWANTESNLYRQQQQSQAKSLVKLSAYALGNELSEENWGQIRVDLDLLMRENQDFLYILVSDARKKKSDSCLVAQRFPKPVYSRYCSSRGDKCGAKIATVSCCRNICSAGYQVLGACASEAWRTIYRSKFGHQTGIG